MTKKEKAQKILELNKAIYQPRHEYVSVREDDFSYLDLNFYRKSSEFLESKGFKFLDDFENITISSAHGGPFKPAMIRCMASSDGNIMAGIYHARFKSLWSRIHSFLIGFYEAKVIDLETEFTDGSFVCTSNAMSASAAELPKEINSEYLPAKTPIAIIYECHKIRIEERQESTGLYPLALKSLKQVRDSQDRMNIIKAAFRNDIGIISLDKLKRLSRGNCRLAEEIHAEIRKIQDEDEE